MARRASTTLALYERPPSEDWQHLPFILLAEAGVKSDDRATPAMASDKTTASVLIFLSLGFVVRAYNHENRL
jgi:hypothetical protein